MNGQKQIHKILILVLTISSVLSAQSLNPARQAEQILKICDIKGGLIVHIGCGDGQLTTALYTNSSYLIHGLDRSTKHVAQAREYLQSLGVYGNVSIDKLEDNTLPYIDNLANLVVSEDLGTIPMSEVMRILCPNGVAYIRSNGQWTKTIKPRPKEIDEWTHYLHDASNNAVSHDDIVGPPRHMQWIGSPRYARHHDRMSSVSAAVTTNGRVFYIIDEAPRASILIPPKWTLIARDAFNGTILWKRPLGEWFTHLWPLKSGPAQLPRRLVAVGDRVYVTLALDAPLTALDAVTGNTIQTYPGTQATEEVIFSDSVLFALVNDAAEKTDYHGSQRFTKGYNTTFWDEANRKIVAIRADSGEILWTDNRRVLPATLAVDRQRVIFHDGASVVCLDRNTGKEIWHSKAIARTDKILAFYLPILVLYEDIVFFSGGETAGSQTGSWYMKGKDTMTALSAQTGDILWTAYHPPSGYRSPEDLLVANGLVWTGETTSGRASGTFTGRDPHTGEIKIEFAPNLDVYWFHHRCYRGKATDNYLLMSRTGTEFLDVNRKQWIPHHWVRGACLYGVMPANGLVYNPPHPCACYLETKLYGFNAVAPKRKTVTKIPPSNRLEKGPAYEKISNLKFQISNPKDWPTYRHDAARSGMTNTPVPAALKPAWRATIKGQLTSPVIAENKVFVASVETHTLYALDAASGEKLWHYIAGGRIDSPPTIYQGRVLFGSADGWVYCLDASTGSLAWRFRAAPLDQRLTSFEQLESVWPVPGNVLIQDGVLYCVAGRSVFLDGGLHLWRLDPQTGRTLSHTVLDDRDPESDGDLHNYVSWLNMPVGLPDILSSDGKLIYMRSQPFHLDGTRLPLEKMPAGTDADRGAPPPTQRVEHAHLFSPTGYLDDTFWHRTYWMYGSTFVSGWCGYYLSGKVAPAGKILVFDDSTVYGFGRKPQYYKWTTPIEHQLFAASKDSGAAIEDDSGRSLISIEKSKSLNPAGKAVTVEAWIKSQKANGVILARGGNSQGYVLYLQNGQPTFAVRTNGNLAFVNGKTKVVGKWVHLAGILTDDKQLRIYRNGTLAGSTKAPGLLTGNPAEAMEIGVDGGSTVGDYAGPLGFNGLIDEVRVYHRALSQQEIEKEISAGRPADKKNLILSYSFDRGNALDESSNKNNGKAEGVVAVKGKIGWAMKFTGSAGSVPGFAVQHNWTQDIPLLARAMVLSDRILFVAGPPDLVDEPKAFRQIDDPVIQRNLADQADAFNGNKGALLLAVSTADGKTLAQYDLDSPPVFDGMAAANERLYMSTMNGQLICFQPAQ
ncbi:MAG: PQQ-binding-like beta-propeller repeat protein [Sedimentisphaerales bacterium]|nr:PQQ-binding-like beta-propeller repeat protein [Sedimentisphaerales bacterium]